MLALIRVVRLPHLFHRDPDWQQRGPYAYYQCRCGARRVRHIVVTLPGTILPGWPRLVDRHGRRVYDSGWRP